MPTEFDCLGDMCPIPIMKLQQCKELTQSGQKVKLITDHSCVVESITDYCKKLKLQLEVVEAIPGVWELYVTKP
ncbi:MAG: sulfurtransferase TusA family protein [Angelakisella sp.]|nr:sulfurtransferase TusA family protein [Angelakisella sp.]